MSQASATSRAETSGSNYANIGEGGNSLWILGGAALLVVVFLILFTRKP